VTSCPAYEKLWSKDMMMNDRLRENARKVCATIREAFPVVDVSPPEELTVQPCYEVERDFRGKHWTEVSTGRLLEDHGEATLKSLTARAFRYYLPAFMLTAVGSQEAASLAEDVVYALLPPYEGVADSDADFLRQCTEEVIEDFADMAGDKADELRRLAEENCEDSLVSRKTEEQETIKEFIAKVGEFALEQRKAIWLFLEYMEQTKSVDLLMDGLVWENLKRFWRDGLLPLVNED
jgi:hypothetical protein